MECTTHTLQVRGGVYNTHLTGERWKTYTLEVRVDLMIHLSGYVTFEVRDNDKRWLHVP